jgi:RNA 2',3'-cyclic 3'-phosphodiesterase
MKAPMRLFTALDLPQDVIGRLETLLDQLRPTAQINWARPSNLHITTKFIGHWPDERLDEVKAALAGIRSPALQVAVRGFAFVPNERLPRVLFCKVDAPGIDALAAATDRATAALGIESESRVYKPHLTLARIKERGGLERLRTTIAALPSTDFGAFDARSFFLYQSKMQAGGSVYTKLAEFPLSH